MVRACPLSLNFPTSFLILDLFVLSLDAKSVGGPRLREALVGLGVCFTSVSRTESRCVPRTAIALGCRLRSLWMHSSTSSVCRLRRESSSLRCRTSRHRIMPAATQNAWVR